MEEFLNTTYNNLQSNHYENLTLVLGNESCDLDSAVGSLVYASFLYWQYNRIKCRLCTKAMRDEAGYKDDIFVPVLNVDRQDFSLKTEIVYLFQEYGIPKEKLIFRNDFDLEQLVLRRKAAVTLVDHHVLAARDRCLGPYVTEVIDHRPLDTAKWVYKLIAGRHAKYGGVGRLLLHAGRGADKDAGRPHRRHGVLHRFRRLPRASTQKTRLEALERARADVSSLTASQLLRKDVKIVGRMFVPSFPILVEEVLKRPGVAAALEDALLTHNCQLGVLLGMRLNPGGQRDMAIYAPPEYSELGQKLLQHLQGWSRPALELQSRGVAAPGVLHCDQLNRAASRKQYVPALQAFDAGL